MYLNVRAALKFESDVDALDVLALDVHVAVGSGFGLDVAALATVRGGAESAICPHGGKMQWAPKMTSRQSCNTFLWLGRHTTHIHFTSAIVDRFQAQCQQITPRLRYAAGYSEDHRCEFCFRNLSSPWVLCRARGCCELVISVLLGALASRETERGRQNLFAFSDHEVMTAATMVSAKIPRIVQMYLSWDMNPEITLNVN